MDYSKISKRFFAFYFDSIVVSGIVFALLLILKLINIEISYEGLLKGDISSVYKINLLYFLVFLVYEVIFLTSNLSSTPGKIILGVEVVSRQSSFVKVLIRSMVKVIVTLPGIAIISGLVAVFSDRKQSIHDMLAGTYVTDFSSRKQSFSIGMDSPEFHEEMKKRGIRTYSEQQALAQEMFGKSGKFGNGSLLKKPILWVIILLISIFVCILYFNSVASELKGILQFK